MENRPYALYEVPPIRDLKELLWRKEEQMPEKHIAIISGNSYEWMLAFCSIVNGGNVAVPIDKELPKEEIARLLCQADVTAVFCSKSCR